MRLAVSGPRASSSLLLPSAAGLVLAAALTACAGDNKGGASGGDSASGGADGADGGAVAEAVAAELGPEGGAISATDAGGATLQITVPPGALRSPTTITVQPLDPVDGAPRFAISPAGLSPSLPVGLRLEGASLPAGALLRWADAEGGAWLQTTDEGGALVAEVASLGFLPAPAAAARAADPAAAELTAAPFDCAADYDAITETLAAPVARGDVDAINRELEGLRASAAACASADIERRRTLACARFDATVTSHRALAVEDIDDFAFVAGGLARAHDAVILTGGSCALEAFTPLLAEKYEQMLVFLGARYARSPFSDDMDVHLDALEQLLRYESSCFLVGVDEDTCTQLRAQLYPGVLDRLRAAAWAECRATGIPTGPAGLLGHRPAGVPTAEPTEAYMRYAPYTVATLQRDAATCTGALELRIFDDADLPEEVEGLRQTVAAGEAPGSFPLLVRTEAAPTGALSLRGALKAETCDGAAATTGALVARVNGVELARLAAVRGAYPLDTLGLHVDVADALAAAGLPASGGTFTVVVQREDGDCPLYGWPGSLLEIEVQAAELQLDAELIGGFWSSIHSSIITSADCDADSYESTDTSFSPEGDAPVPVTMSVPGASLQWSVGAGLTGTWSAALPAVTDTCEDGREYTESSTAGFSVELIVVPRVAMDLLLTGPEPWLAGFTVAAYTDRAAAEGAAGALAVGTPVDGGLAISTTPPQALRLFLNGSASSVEPLDGAVIALTPVVR